jgi:hypothetical protein
MRDHARIPRWAIGCKALSASDWRILACISLHRNTSTGFAFPGMTTIAAMTGVRREDVPRSIIRLEQQGLLRRKRQVVGSGWGWTCYEVVFDDGVGVRDIADTSDSRVSANLREGCPQKGTRGVRKSAALTIEGTDSRTDSVLRTASVNGHGFDEFWRVYPPRHPHSNPKKLARLKFEALIERGEDPAKIVSGAQHYRETIERERIDPRYVAQAITWLNQERFADDQPPPEPPPRLRVGMN